MGSKYFDWHHQSIRKKIVVHHPVEDVDRAIITRTSEQGVLRTKTDISDSFLVVLQCLVGFVTTHIHIKPKNFFIVSPQNEVVALGMHGNAANPLGPRLILVHNSLFLQVVLEHCDVRGCEEVRLRGMERNCLDDAFSSAEGSLAVSFAYTVNQHLACRLDVVSYRGEVVTF